jgi:hypothetical protein
VPQLLDFRHLREEPVTTEIEAPAVTHDGAADAPDLVVCLEHDRTPAAPGQEVGRRQATRTRAGDDDGWIRWHCHEQVRIVDDPTLA